jgi:hypothetical protein
MRTIAPEVKAVEQPVQLLNAQHNGFVTFIGRCFEPFGFEAFEPKAKAVALPVEDFHAITWAIQENEKHGIEHRDFNIQLNQSGQAINGFSKVHGLGVEIDFFDFGVGSHHEGLAPERDREHSIEHQIAAWNVEFMERLLLKKYML